MDKEQRALRFMDHACRNWNLDHMKIGPDDFREFADALEAELAEAVLAEREACAKVAEYHRAPKGVPQIDYDCACADIAAAIRERT